MKREIKFRARITENGKPKMFYQEDQYLISFLRRVTSFLYFEKYDKGKVDDFNGGVHESRLEDNLENYLDRYTGLKDKNGKEIYEGDIVEFSSFEEGREREVVSWAEHFTGFCFSKKDANLYEIIGNIYENPDLQPPYPR
jgi:uncharacterized phage protein (TIGR01671 family)